MLVCCFLAAAILTGTTISARAVQSISLAWDQNTETNIAGYRVLYGTSSGQYTRTQEIGPATSTVISDLAEGQTYYFAVTAYDIGGLESAPSSEVSFLTSAALPTPTPNPTATPAPTASPVPSPTPAPTATPVPTATPGGTPVPTPSPGGTPVPTPSPGATPTPTPAAAPTTLLNVSTRANVQTGDKVLIGGLIIAGDTPKKVVLRAIGPSLTAAGVSNALRDPQLSLFNSKGEVIASNNNWRTNASAIQAVGLAPSSDYESAIVTTLVPGGYTAILSGVGNSSGVALFELYDAATENSRIGNISTRGKVEGGDNVLIGGFILGGAAPSRVVVRALGPSLANGGVEETLADPSLDLYDSTGTQVSTNDNWRSSSQSQEMLSSGLAPSDDRESAILATLPPGSYTAIVRSASSSTGVALVEVYNLAN